MVKHQAGKSREYVSLFEEFGRGERRPEHILAYYEAYDIVELCELWGNDIGRFPGLKTRLEKACGKGPTMTDDEKTSNSSNKPRNDAFVYLMAGRFNKAGISVNTVDGIRAGSGKSKSTEDFSIRWNGLDINIECKRPNSANGFEGLAKGAQKQIKRRRRRGIIMMDCSRLVRPAYEAFEAESPNAAADELHRRLEKEVEPKVPRPMARKILGCVLFARIPAMTAIESLDANEQALRRRDCITAIRVVDKRYPPSSRTGPWTSSRSARSTKRSWASASSGRADGRSRCDRRIAPVRRSSSTSMNCSLSRPRSGSSRSKKIPTNGQREG